MIAAILLASSLYEQAVSRILAMRFPATEYVLIELAHDRVVTSNSLDEHQPIPVGSLVKPLLAASLGADRTITCEPGRCWLPRGHGRVGIVDAIAFSCNEWFAGKGLDEKMTPIKLARGYERVTEIAAVREGMRKAAEVGTARKLGMKALAKTGTAKCSHAKRGPGDGLVVAMWPEEQPKYLLMVRVHGTTGAVAAETAGSLLRVVRDGK